MDTITTKSTIIIGIIVVATYVILKLVTAGSVQRLSAAAEYETETTDSWDEKCESTKRVVYQLMKDNQGSIYILRGVPQEDWRYEDATIYKYVAPLGGDASWREHDMGVKESDWISHTIDPEIALYYATDGYENYGAICYKKINNFDLQGDVGYGGEFNEYQIGFKGMVYYNGYIEVGPETSVDEVRELLETKGVQTYY